MVILFWENTKSVIERRKIFPLYLTTGEKNIVRVFVTLIWQWQKLCKWLPNVYNENKQQLAKSFPQACGSNRGQLEGTVVFNGSRQVKPCLQGICFVNKFQFPIQPQGDQWTRWKQQMTHDRWQLTRDCLKQIVKHYRSCSEMCYRDMRLNWIKGAWHNNGILL